MILGANHLDDGAKRQRLEYDVGEHRDDRECEPNFVGMDKIGDKLFGVKGGGLRNNRPYRQYGYDDE